MKKHLALAILLSVVAMSCKQEDPAILDARVTVYPNPATGTQATVGIYLDNAYFTLIVYDPKGKQIVNFKNGGDQNITYQYPLTLSEKGNYRIMLKADKLEFTRILVHP
jgi:hypothetical protein